MKALFPAQNALVNVLPCRSDRGDWCWSPAVYMRPMQQKCVRCFPLSPGSGRDARLPCITTPELFKQFLFGMCWPGATSQHISTMSKKGPAAFTSMQTSYMETNAGRDQVQVRVAFHATRFHGRSPWNERASFPSFVAFESLVWLFSLLQSVQRLTRARKAALRLAFQEDE